MLGVTRTAPSRDTTLPMMPHHMTATATASSSSRGQPRQGPRTVREPPCPSCGPFSMPSCASWCGFSGVRKFWGKKSMRDAASPKIEPTANQALREKLTQMDIPYKDYLEIKDIFQLLDTDDDGIIAKVEFLQMMNNYGLSANAAAREFIDKYGNDDSICLNDFLLCPFAKEFGKKFAQSRQAFDAIDTNRTGAISVLDFSKLASSMDMAFASPSEMIEAFREIDRDGDGQISWPQFARVWNEITLSVQKKSVATYNYKRADEIDWRPSTPSNSSEADATDKRAI